MKLEFIHALNEWGQKGEPFFFVIDFLCENLDLFKKNQLTENKVFVDFPNFDNSSDVLVNLNRNHAYFNPIYPSFHDYKKAFNAVQKFLKRGDTYLLNLTFPTQLKGEINLKEIFTKAKAKYKILYKDEWVCYSPEPFIRIRDNKIYTYPMKGTIDASIPEAEKKILHNEKEMAEHATIVDLMRNDLSRVAKNVRVTDYRFLTKIKTEQGELLQVSSEIMGDLSQNWKNRIGQIFSEILPAGSISGAPKEKTVELIQEIETYPRNYYTGIAGYFDGVTLDTCVLIRFIEKSTTGFFYKSGGGITTQSDVKEEYEELKQKVYVPIY